MRTLLVLATTMILLIGCGSREPSRPPGDGSIADYVVGPAAEGLDDNGRFRRLYPVATAEGEISPSEAIRQAEAWVTQFAPWHSRRLQEKHGRQFKVEELRSCGDPVYAHSSFRALDPGIDVVYRRPWSSWWIVALCDGAVPRVSLAVSAFNTDVQVIDGKLQFPQFSGNEFRSMGIPPGWGAAVSLSPEQAVRMAATLTGRRIDRIPVLIAPSPRSGSGTPHYARWRIHLETPANVTRRRGGRQEQTSTVFLGLEPAGSRSIDAVLEKEVMIPADSQPSSESFFYVPNIRSDPRPGRQYVQGDAFREDSIPIAFDPVDQ